MVRPAAQREVSGHVGESVARGSLRQQVTERILHGIFEGRFESGGRLVVQALSDLYKVSPTPVRESLVELASLGLVDLLPNRGAVLRRFGPREVREISQIRRVLEVEATRGACGRIDPAALTALRSELERLEGMAPDAAWDRDARAADSRLHGLIAGACGSARLDAEIRRYLTLFAALRDVAHRREARNNYTRTNDIAEHLEIVRALAVPDAEASARAMDRHVRSAARFLEEVVFAGPEAEEVDA